jgi:7-carboxy-7-deazaguanine synthase
MYRINDLFYTLQGEGTHTGRPAVFLRFTGCNLWTGREEDRHKAACTFCDTDFTTVAATYDTAAALATAVDNLWPAQEFSYRGSRRFVVLTGGEPTIQVDRGLVLALHNKGFYVAIETNGTRDVCAPVDWICLSPKAGTHLRQRKADEVKLVYPQPELQPEQVEWIQAKSFRLQPMDGPDLDVNTKAAIEYCLSNPRWSLSLQTHKLIGIA